MRDTNIGMVKIWGCEKVHDRFYGLVSITLDNIELKLKFGTDEQGYAGLVRAIQLRPFDNKTSEPYRHYFVGAYNKKTSKMRIRVEQGQTNKQFEVECSSIALVKNLLWFQTIKDKEQVKYLLDLSDDNMFEEIKKFTSKKTGVDISELTRQTRVGGDLGIAGLDTISFFEEYFKTFQINFTNRFTFDKYVASEVYKPFGFIKGLFLKRQKEKQKIIELTLGDLERTALTGTWNEPETQS